MMRPAATESGFGGAAAIVMEGDLVSTTVFFVAFACLGWAMFVVKRRLGISASRPAPASRRLTYSEKFSRLAMRWRDPQWRDYAMLLLAGKALGIALLFGLVIGGPALIRY